MYISLSFRMEYWRSLRRYDINGSHSNRLLVPLNVQHVHTRYTMCIVHVHTWIYIRSYRKSCINMEAKANAKSISTSIFAHLFIHITLKLDWEQSNCYLTTNLIQHFYKFSSTWLWSIIWKNFQARNIIYLSHRNAIIFITMIFILL